MPKLRRQHVPRAVMEHLALRMREREVGVDQMGLFAEWCDTNPDVPDGEWFKVFPGMTVCGEGDLVKTFLVPGQIPYGQEVT